MTERYQSPVDLIPEEEYLDFDDALDDDDDLDDDDLDDDDIELYDGVASW